MNNKTKLQKILNKLEGTTPAKTAEFDDKDGKMTLSLSESFFSMVRGEKGDQGDEGIQGEVGPQGDVGPQGEIGERGPQGIQGLVGPKGDRGPQGNMGPQGRTGIQGLKGDNGLDGNDGSPDTPDQIIEKVNKSTKLIDRSRVAGINDLLSKGGGSQNRKITLNSVDPLTRYTDFNLIAGSVMGFSYANDDVNKRVNITLSSSGGGGSGTVTSVLAGQGISVDNSTPSTPIVSRSSIIGDVSIPNNSDISTLATVNSNVGSFTNSSITVNAKGLITAASSGSATTPGGSDTQVQFNDAGSFGGDAAFTWNKTTNVLSIINTAGGETANADSRFVLDSTGNQYIEFLDQLGGATLQGIRFNDNIAGEGALIYDQSTRKLEVSAAGSVRASFTADGLMLATGKGLVTGKSDTNTALLQAYDVDGAAYTTFGTLTAGNTPTFDLTVTTLTLTNPLGVTSGGTGTATQFTQGSVVFAGASGVYTQDNTSLFFDDTNNTLIVGAASIPATSPTTGVSRANFVAKSDAAVLGSELITATADRDFSSDTGNWTGTNWTIGGGVATHTAGANAFTLNTAALSSAIVVGSTYVLKFTLVTTVAGTLSASVGGTSAGNGFGQSVGTETAVMPLATAGTTAAIVFTPSAAWTGTIDNVSLKLVTESTPVISTSNSTNAAQVLQVYTDSTGGVLGIGINSLRSNTTGTLNLGIGSAALRDNLTGIGNIAIGANALSNNTTGSSNIAIGEDALRDNITGTSNFAIGANNLILCSTGTFNTAIGSSNSPAIKTGSFNTGIGSAMFTNLVSGSYNVAIGYHALRFLGAANAYNTSIGTESGANNTGDNNVFVGYGAGSGTSMTGSNNTIIGYLAGNNAVHTGSNNITIGYDIDTPTGSSSNQLTIGNLIFSAGIDGTGTTLSTGGIGIGVVLPSAKLHVLKTTEQLRVGYDASNYYSTTVSSAGVVTLNAVGASAGFTFSDSITLSTVNIVTDTTTGTKIGTGTTQKLGFWNATPVVQSTGWSVTNESSDKSYDADATTIDELADVLGTLIEVLKTYGILGA